MISDIFKSKKQPVSLEMFPPKGELSLENAVTILEEICPLKPDFISVTYHSRAGAVTPVHTIEIAAAIKNWFNIESMAHLTCINSNKNNVHATLEALKESGVDNILALRGDIPEGYTGGDYLHATDLLREVKGKGFSLGAACYPEGHLDSPDLDDDITHLLEKQDAGADFFVSQLFFDNSVFIKFIEKARLAGITVPISAGIMPILSQSQVSRMIFTCGVSLPSEIIRILNRYESSPQDLAKAGIDYARSQMNSILKETDCGVHIYTMNRADIAKGIIGGTV